MKIVHAVYSMEVGGAEMLVAQLARMQRRNGHQVSVCAYRRLGALGEQLQAEGIPVLVLGEAPPCRTMFRYLCLFRSTRPDVVHCHNPAPMFQAAAGARLAGVHCVLATRHSLVAPPCDTAAEIKFNLWSWWVHWIAGICEITAANVRNTPLARRTRIVRVYNGAAPLADAEPMPNLPTDELRLLFVGRLAPVKDLPMLIRAMRLAVDKAPHLRLWIVGDGAVRTELETLVQTLGLQHHVHFWGERLDTTPFFRSVHAFAMSSRSEGLPMSLLQAMSAGLPAIVTSVGGMQEVTDLAQSGLSVPVGDTQAMAEAILLLAGSPELRATLGQRALAAYAAHFTLDRMAARYEELYRKPNELSASLGRS